MCHTNVPVRLNGFSILLFNTFVLPSNAITMKVNIKYTLLTVYKRKSAEKPNKLAKGLGRLKMLREKFGK